jgi:CO dehydrogenase maturation factor
MRAAFIGKGGSGKTTTASLFAHYLQEEGWPVLAIDADINQQLGIALGMEQELLDGRETLSQLLPTLKMHLRGSNKRINEPEEMIKTTPPGKGSNLLCFSERSSVLERATCEQKHIRLLRAGVFETEDLGVRCFHSKTGSVELILNHLLDGSGEYVLVDMTAGADAFASGLFTKFDVTFGIVEPTRASVDVFLQYANYARQFSVELLAVGNKIQDQEDVEFLKNALGSVFIGGMSQSVSVRKRDKGIPSKFPDIEPENKALLARLKGLLDEKSRNWELYQANSLEFHRRNALSWANAEYGKDLTRQIDPDFVYPSSN